jgi:hypothetical protein
MLHQPNARAPTTTLCMILAGVHRADAGSKAWRGHREASGGALQVSVMLHLLTAAPELACTLLGTCSTSCMSRSVTQPPVATAAKAAPYIIDTHCCPPDALPLMHSIILHAASQTHRPCCIADAPVCPGAAEIATQQSLATCSGSWLRWRSLAVTSRRSLAQP